VGRIGDSRCPVHAQPDVVVSAKRRLTRVHPHPDPYRSTFGPRRIRQRTLGLHRCPNSLRRLDENRKEGVSLGRELSAMGVANGVPENHVVTFEDWRVAIPQRGGETSAPLNIREQERDGSRGKISHSVATAREPRLSTAHRIAEEQG